MNKQIEQLLKGNIKFYQLQSKCYTTCKNFELYFKQYLNKHHERLNSKRIAGTLVIN